MGGTSTTDCSPMSSYECQTYDSAEARIYDDADGVKTLYFEGTVSVSDACGEATCPECTSYRSCAGPWLQTDPVTMPAGSFVHWEWLATGNVDWYEVVVAVYKTDGTLVSVSFQRGGKTGWVQEELAVDTAGSFFVRFHLGSYDETGGGQIGAEMKVRNFQFVYPETTTTTTTASVTTTTRSTTVSTATASTTSTTTASTTRTSTTTSSSATSTTTTLCPPTAVSCPTCEEPPPAWPLFLAGLLVGLVLGLCLALLLLYCLRPRPTKVEPLEPEPEAKVPEAEAEEVRVEVEEEPEVVMEQQAPAPPPPPEIFNVVEEVQEELPPEPPPEPEPPEPEVELPMEDPEMDIEKVIISLYPTLKCIFQFYSSAATVGDADLWRMNLKQWLLLIEDCKINVTRTRAEIIFKTCISDGKKAQKKNARPDFLRVSRSPHAELSGMAMRSLRGAGSRPKMAEEEKDLGYAEFVNALVHLGWDHLSTVKRAKAREVRTTAGLALWNLVEDKVRPHAGRFDGCVALRSALQEPPAKGVLARAAGDGGAFGKVWKRYVNSKAGRMDLRGFDDFARDAGLVSNKNVSMVKLRECFVWAGDKDRGRAPEGWIPSDALSEEGRVLTGPDYGRDEQLTRQEFAMACARIACMLRSKSLEVDQEGLAAAIKDFAASL